MDSRIYQMLSLCQKAGKLVTGEFAAKEAVLNQTAYLVIVATDASNNTKKLFNDKTSYRNIPCVQWGTKEEIGDRVGKNPRAVIAIVDENFARKIKELIGES
nr:ribosomal L7Ae/L30e/S12e/Gadd45 family protein [uncultured Cellulosilyticum sp.]